MFLVYSTSKHESPEDSLTSYSGAVSHLPRSFSLVAVSVCAKGKKRQGNLVWQSLDCCLVHSVTLLLGAAPTL